MKAGRNTYWPKGLPRTLELPKTSLYYNLEVAATRYPDKPAVVFYDSVLSYSELRQQVRALAGYLQLECGVCPGDRVALYSQNSPQYVIGYYAILRAQGVVVPINPMNLSEELKYCVSDSGARTALVSQELYGNAQPLLASGDLDHVIVHAYSDYLTAATDLAVPSAVTEPRQEHTDPGVILWRDVLSRELAPSAFTGEHDDLAIIGYTSGTTGHPKGCVHSHSTVMAAVAASAVWLAGILGTGHCPAVPFFGHARWNEWAYLQRCNLSADAAVGSGCGGEAD